jgi:hypothetical protein
MKYTLLEKDRVKFISLVLLNEIIQFQHYFQVHLTGDDIYLDSFLKGLVEKGALKIDKGMYVPTDKGREELVMLYDKYYEFVKFFDIFCAVDLEHGEFAFQSINSNMSDEEWVEFLHNERFSDVRVAVAEFKGINPFEIVFMSFLNENRFDCTQSRWQYYLTGNDIWNEIVEICNTAVSLEYLKEEGVIENVVSTGSELALAFIKQAEATPEPTEEVTETVVEEYVETVSVPVYGYDYWDPYYDPFYVSPIWLAAAIVLW